MKDLQVIVNESILNLAKNELFILGAVCAAIIATTILLVCKELKNTNKGDNK